MSSVDENGEPGSRPGGVRRLVASESTQARGARAVAPTPDRSSELSVEQLYPGHYRREQTVVRLREVLLRVAYHELSRRRRQLRTVAGQEFDDLAHQATNDALMKILRNLGAFRRDSRFTTWAYTFVIFEVSTKLARHAWRNHPLANEALVSDRIPDSLSPRPGDRLEQREQLDALAAAIRELPDRQREVFVAIALNRVPSDVLALKLGSNRNAIYKNLFDARRSLRAKLAAAGHPVFEQTAST
jgi:RNA polymerase sigma-70 factor (ECF subfamily)